MKVMSYNVSWCNQDKIDWLLFHDDVDIFVIPECGNEENVLTPKGYKFFWVGDYATKGLGIMVNERCQCEIAPSYDKALRYAIPLIVDAKYFVLAVWSTKRSNSDSYIDILLEILNYYKSLIAQYPTVIIGDYNIISNKKESKPIFEWMGQHGLKSAHHLISAEEMGKELQPTYYHQYKENMPFFIDYAFVNTEVKESKLYSWGETKRMSDHVPLMVEI